jgi:hypothetical protein
MVSPSVIVKLALPTLAALVGAPATTGSDVSARSSAFGIPLVKVPIKPKTISIAISEIATHPFTAEIVRPAPDRRNNLGGWSGFWTLMGRIIRGLSMCDFLKGSTVEVDEWCLG